MKHSETLMWKEITETPRVFGEIQAANLAVMQKLVADVKDSGKTNFVAAARGTSDHALIFFKYVLEVNSHYTVGLSAPSNCWKLLSRRVVLQSLIVRKLLRLLGNRFVRLLRTNWLT